MRLEDYLRQCLDVQQGHGLVLAKLPDGRWQASLERSKRGTFTVEVHADPVDAIWNACCPFHLRRKAGAQPWNPVASPALPADEEDDDLLGAPAAAAQPEEEDLIG